MGFRKAKLGESQDLLKDQISYIVRNAFTSRPGAKTLLELGDGFLRVAPSQRPPQRLSLPGGKACQGDGHLDHLILIEDDAQRLLERRLQKGMIVWGGVLLSLRQRPPLSGAALHIRVNRSADDGPGTNDRDLDRQLVQVARLRPGQ